jgi:hypothetical protein
MSKEGIHTERFLSFEHEGDGTPDFMCKDGKRLALAVLADQATVIELSLFISSEEETGCLGEGPVEMGVADFAVFSAGLFSS